jgi:acyl carrier protein
MKPDRNEIMKQLVEALHRASGGRVRVEHPSPGLKIVEDLGVTSLEMFELAFEIEERWGLKLTEQAMKKLRTVGDAVEMIAASMDGSAQAA